MALGVPGIAALLALGMMPAGVSGQRVVPAHQEPRHRLVLDDPRFRVLDIEIVPGDTTDYHLHDTPIAYVRIGSARVNTQVLGRPWASPTATAPLPTVGGVSWDEQYPETPLSHRVANTDTRPFRLIGVLNRGRPAAEPGTPDLGSAGPAEAEGRWFRSAHRVLEPGGALGWTAYGRPVVAVLVSDGRLEVSTGPGTAETREGPGSFVLLEAGSAVRLSNPGDTDLSLAFVEVR